MKLHGTSTLIAIAALMTGALGQALVESRFNGIWQGKRHDLPAITLRLANEGGKLEGKVTFFLHKRDTENEPWYIEGQDSATILNPTITGNRLSFEVQHYKYHGAAELGPNVKMTLELTGPDQAKLGDVTLVREK